MMPISPTGRSNSRGGFTLLELMVVISLLALISLISLPLMMDRGETAERRTLRRVVGVVKQLYNEATLTRDPHLLTFDLDRDSLSAYRLRQRGAQVEKQALGKQTKLSSFDLQQVDIEGKGSFRSGRVSVKIFPLGWMEQTQLFLRTADGKFTRMAFSPLTGSVKIDAQAQPLQ